MGIFTTDLRTALLCSVSVLPLMAAQVAQAGPEGGVVEAGTATITTPSASTTQITQQSNKAIINWNSFDVGVGETARFVLPGSSSVTLNRDFSGVPSEILGHVESNGRFYLVNPSGILFGHGSSVDVAGLVATTHDIRSADFLSGNLDFSIPGDPTASVINYGQITVDDLGFGAFVAPHVRNDGAIVANLSKVELASASGFKLDMHGDDLISFFVENPNDHQIFDANGTPVTALVENNGSITADGGQVVLSARAARGVVDSVINTDGIIRANTVAQRGGKIILGGGDAGVVRVNGTVSAQGEDAGERGGEIRVTGEFLLADEYAWLNASGWHGGGKLLFGGDYLGGNTTNEAIAHLNVELEDEVLPTSKAVILAEGAKLQADATQEGDGGKVIVWSDESTITNAFISARGGSIVGDGGFIETSGGYLHVGEAADASAVNGDGGMWLLDPIDITVSNEANQNWTIGSSPSNFGANQVYLPENSSSPSVINANVVEAALNNGVDVEISSWAGNGGLGDGNIYVTTDINFSNGGLLAFNALNRLIISPGVNLTGIENLVFAAPNSVIIAQDIGSIDITGTLEVASLEGITLSSGGDRPPVLLVNRSGDWSTEHSVDPRISIYREF